MTYVYWLHLLEHVDILSQGYIGVSKRPKRRLYEHKTASENVHLQRAFEKYNEKVKITVLLEASDQYCYEIEKKLRPKDHIGWNIQLGGDRPPDSSHWKGRKHSPESIEKMSASKRGKFGRKHSPETIEKIRLANVGKKKSRHTEEWKKEASERMKGNSNAKGMKHSDNFKLYMKERMSGKNNPNFRNAMDQ